MKNLRSTRSLIASLAAAPIMMAAAWPAMAQNLSNILRNRACISPTTNCAAARALVSGSINPLRRLSVILRHDLAELEHDAEKILHEAAASINVLTKTLWLLGGGSAPQCISVVDWLSRDGSSKCRH
jgi:hypothetical protein